MSTPTEVMKYFLNCVFYPKKETPFSQKLFDISLPFFDTALDQDLQSIYFEESKSHRF